MPWYFWVWGIVSTIGCLGLVLIAILATLEVRDHLRGRTVERRLLNRVYRLENDNAALKNKNRKLERDVAELTKGRNEYGCISP